MRNGTDTPLRDVWGNDFPSRAQDTLEAMSLVKILYERNGSVYVVFS